MIGQVGNKVENGAADLPVLSAATRAAQDDALQ